MKRWIIAAAIMATTVPVAVGNATAGVPTEEVQVVRLECEARAVDDVAAAPVVHCRWSEPPVPPASAIRLWRLVDPGSGQARQVIYRSDDLDVHEFTDDAVRPGHAYLYAVQLLDADGRIVGRSRVDVVRIPATRPGLEVIELGCELADGAESVHCRWSSPTAAGAEAVALWRSVNGRARERVASFPADGQTAYRDRVPSGASRLVYAVIVTDADGRIVGRSRPERLAIPPDPADTRPPDTRPPDTRPVETRPPVETHPTATRPSETHPADTRPSDTQPIDTQPVETRPVDTRPATVTTVAGERRPGEGGGP